MIVFSKRFLDFTISNAEPDILGISKKISVKRNQRKEIREKKSVKCNQ